MRREVKVAMGEVQQVEETLEIGLQHVGRSTRNSVAITNKVN